MAEEKPQPEEAAAESSSLLYYVIGALVVVAIAAGVWMLRPQPTTGPMGLGTPLIPTPTPGPITSLACERQYYNPVIGFTQYFLGVDGVALPAAKRVTCDFTVSVGGSVMASESAKGELVAAPARSGQTFTCRSKKLDLTPDINTDVTVAVKDDLGAIQTCPTTTFNLPKP